MKQDNLSDSSPIYSVVTYGPEEFIDEEGEQFITIVKGRKEMVSSIMEFWDKASVHIFVESQNIARMDLDKELFTKSMAFYRKLLKEPFDLEIDTFMRGFSLTRQWDSSIILCEFFDCYLIFQWYTTA